MPMPKLPEPVRVSPVIKFFRYAFLIAGIFYGSSRRSYLKHKEVHVREKEQKLKAERDAQLAEEKKRAGENELTELEKMFLPKECPSATEGAHSVVYEEKKEQPYHAENLSKSPIDKSSFDKTSVDEKCFSEQSNALDKEDDDLQEKQSTKSEGKDDFMSFPINLKPKRDGTISARVRDHADLKPTVEEAITVDEPIIPAEGVNSENNKPYYFRDNTPTTVESTESLPFIPSDDKANTGDSLNTYKDSGSLQLDSGYIVKDFSKGIPFETTEPASTPSFENKSREEASRAEK